MCVLCRIHVLRCLGREFRRKCYVQKGDELLWDWQKYQIHIQ